MNDVSAREVIGEYLAAMERGDREAAVALGQAHVVRCLDRPAAPPMRGRLAGSMITLGGPAAKPEVGPAMPSYGRVLPSAPAVSRNPTRPA
jgi:ketosteroid isomerase-like protein